MSDGPLFPGVHVKLVDLLDGDDRWAIINRCMFAAKRAGISAGHRMIFVHEALACSEYAAVCLLAIDWFDCD